MCLQAGPGVRHPIQCILPPHIAQHLPRHGLAKGEKKEGVAKGLAFDQSFRNLRTGASATKYPARQLRRAQRLAAPWAQAVLASAQKRRSIYDANEKERVPGVVVRREGEPDTGDPEVDQAYHGLGATFDFYAEAYDRNSIDDDGMALDATVHFGKNYDNAFWDGHRMVFGDGDGALFNPFTVSLDVMGHELTHGVVDSEPGLIYWGQPGALNESIADVFGSLVKQYRRKQTAENADWLIGEGLLKTGEALRSLKKPGSAYNDPRLGGRDPQPAHMNDYKKMFDDNGGVHINSGIPNHAFYNVAIKLRGFAWERAGLIWYETLISPSLRPATRFRGFARLTLLTARELFGMDSEEERAVRAGWNAVGISV